MISKDILLPSHVPAVLQPASVETKNSSLPQLLQPSTVCSSTSSELKGLLVALFLSADHPLKHQ